MTPQQIRIVQSTWPSVVPIKDVAARLFYARLFELDPTLEPLFKSDLREQGTKLMQVLDAAVNGLSRFEHIAAAIQALGRRHAGYGVKEAHYDLVGDALLWTLDRGLGPAFTPVVREAWAAVYAALAHTMKSAAAAGKVAATKTRQ
jgi:hemoglobin-like flavoprotein